MQVLEDGYRRRFRKFVGTTEPVLAIGPKDEASVLGGDNLLGVLSQESVDLSAVSVEVLSGDGLP